jgi:cyclopropane fatty-acyl-phospholipid synthase-like methyltransferase
MKDQWNKRYAEKEFIYGRTPNVFFKSFIDNEKPGSILLPAEGEGRNAVYAASMGWDVYAIDFSEIGQQKALTWAAENKVKIQYEVVDLLDWNSDLKVDHIAIFYLHIAPEYQSAIFEKLIGKLKPGGKIILEAFSKKQINYDSGGPENTDLLYDTKTLKEIFGKLKIDFLQERVIELNEGLFHQGEASVLRMIAIKPMEK